jgi:acyl carrier protein
MDIEGFIEKFAEQFDEIPAGQFAAGTHFKENDEWDSMTALSVIAMADEAYNVRLTGNDIKNAVTIQDVYNIVQSRINA